MMTLTARLLTTASLLFVAAGPIVAQDAPAITGTALYRERMALPPNAVFEATLEDVSRADAPAVVVERQRQEHPGNPPFAFTIPYDPKQIEERHTYVVRVRVTVDGKTLFTSTDRQQVLTQGHGSEIGAPILMRRVTAAHTPGPQPVSAPAEPAPLEETYWKLIELNGKPVVAAEHQREASLTFHASNHRVTGSGGCNRLNGSYLLEGSSLHLQGVASTMMACLHGMDTEQAFHAALGKVTAWKVAGSTLQLLDQDNTPLARFQAVALR